MSSALLSNIVLENANNPGTGNIYLGGPPTGRRSFAQAFGNATKCFYYMTDGTQTEWGIATFYAGSPNVLARTTVIGNTAGTAVPLNFTGAMQVYNDTPAEYVVSTDQMPAVLASAGYQQFPGGLIMQWKSAVVTGDASGNAVVTFPVVFPNQCFVVIPQSGDTGPGPSATVVIGGGSVTPAQFLAHFTGPASSVFRVNFVAFGN